MEDRYSDLDLWVSRTVDGRWIDEDGRIFTFSTLSVVPPPGGSSNEVYSTRLDFENSLRKLEHRDLKSLREAMEIISPIPLAEKGRPPRQMPRGFKDVDYYQGDNREVIVCAFLPEDERNAKGKVDHHLPRRWRLVTWELTERDDYNAMLKRFEEEFLEEIGKNPHRLLLQSPAIKSVTERELLRRDAKHSVSAYDNWHATDSDEFVILDDLPARDFIVNLTNDLKVSRTRFAEIVPTEVCGTNALAVARVFASRGEYLDALAAVDITNMDWSAAYWAPQRRELVAHLSSGGTNELISTIRHEAFHQYLSYASVMIPSSPWINEGYAQYFEGVEEPNWTLEELNRLADYLPMLMRLNYSEFYSGTQTQILTNYRLAHSIIKFLEEGAPKVRFDPFKDVKSRYFRALLETQDMLQATTAAFESLDKLKLFIHEWLKWRQNNTKEK